VGVFENLLWENTLGTESSRLPTRWLETQPAITCKQSTRKDQHKLLRTQQLCPGTGNVEAPKNRNQNHQADALLTRLKITNETELVPDLGDIRTHRWVPAPVLLSVERRPRLRAATRADPSESRGGAKSRRQLDFRTRTQYESGGARTRMKPNPSARKNSSETGPAAERLGTGRRGCGMKTRPAGQP
jgi:hypothetical protein